MRTTRSRGLIAVGVIVVVAAVIAAIAVTRWSSSGADDSDPHSAMVTAADFPPGYVVSTLDASDGPPSPPRAVTPAACKRVLDGQARRNRSQKNLSTIIDDDGDAGSPRFSQTVYTSGESVADALAVVRDCPRHTDTSEDGIATVEGSQVTPPRGCPEQARYVRLTRTPISAAGENLPATDYLMGYLQADRTVSVLTQISASGARPDTGLFCTVVARARDRLSG